MQRSPTFADIEAAARRLQGHARLTPLIEATSLSERFGGRVAVKAESLQIAGAFKFRGAYNRLAQLTPQERSRGVVAFSSGNHAQGVAAAGSRLGISTTIVMPRDAPGNKIENTRQLGAHIIFYDRYTESREAIAARLAQEQRATLVPSFDDPDVIAGQGTVGLEMAAQFRSQFDAELDLVLVPCGGGGLVAGCALALASAAPDASVYCVEPEGFDDTARSLASGERRTVLSGARTICDALMAPAPGELTFPINSRLLAGGLVVTEEMVLRAMRYAWSELKLVIEPGGAVALAAALHERVDLRNRKVGIVLSGGNVDAALFRQVLE
jgi:threonine dehydratase